MSVQNPSSSVTVVITVLACGTGHVLNASLTPGLPGLRPPPQSLKPTIRLLSLTSLFLYLCGAVWRFVTRNVLSVFSCRPCHLLLLLCCFSLWRSSLLARGQSRGPLIHPLQVITVTDWARLAESIRTSQRPFKNFLACKVFEECGTNEGSKYKMLYEQLQFQRKYLNFITAKK